MVETGGPWFCLCRVCIVGESSKDGVVLEWTLVDNFYWIVAGGSMRHPSPCHVPCLLSSEKEIGVWRNWILSWHFSTVAPQMNIHRSLTRDCYWANNNHCDFGDFGDSVVPSTLWNSAGKFLHEIRWQWKLWHAVYMEAQFNRFTHSAILHLATSSSHGNPHPICRNSILAPESQPQSIRRSMQIPYIAEICTGIPFTEM